MPAQVMRCPQWPGTPATHDACQQYCNSHGDTDMMHNCSHCDISSKACIQQHIAVDNVASDKSHLHLLCILTRDKLLKLLVV